jgi:hypothetical protein
MCRTYGCGIEELQTAKAAWQRFFGGWAIDHSAGTPILVFEKCSVIEGAQAEYVLALIEADKKSKGSNYK